MKSFADELNSIAVKAKNKIGYKQPKKQQENKEIKRDPQITKKELRQRAKKFLVSLKKTLQIVAKHGNFNYAVLKLKEGTELTSQLDYYEKLIFDGCKKMKLNTEVTELFKHDMTSQLSVGFHIYVEWDTK